jgi:hypothetical protein
MESMRQGQRDAIEGPVILEKIHGLGHRYRGQAMVEERDAIAREKLSHQGAREGIPSIRVWVEKAGHGGVKGCHRGVKGCHRGLPLRVKGMPPRAAKTVRDMP